MCMQCKLPIELVLGVEIVSLLLTQIIACLVFSFYYEI